MHSKVSILINNFNYRRYVGECVRSAIGQDYIDIEVIVVDDGSTDDSVSQLAAYSESIKIIQKENGGQASALNAGYELCTGDIICFLDSDDYFESGKVSAILEVFDEQDVGLVSNDLTTVCDHETDDNKIMYTDLMGIDALSGNIYEKYALDGYKYVFAPTSGLSIRKNIADKLFPLPEDGWRICADNLIAHGSAYLTNVEFIREPLGCYRIHDDNNYHRLTNNKNGRMTVSDMHAYYLRLSGIYRYLDNLQKKTSGRRVISPLECYRIYRNWCFLRAELSINTMRGLVEKNIEYHSKKYGFIPHKYYRIIKFMVLDAAVFLSLLLNLPTYRLRERLRSQELHNIPETAPLSADEKFINYWSEVYGTDNLA